MVVSLLVLILVADVTVAASGRKRLRDGESDDLYHQEATRYVDNHQSLMVHNNVPDIQPHQSNL